jgi:hypothetical protein
MHVLLNSLLKFYGLVCTPGRSLREVEVREDDILRLCQLAQLVLWSVTMTPVVLGKILLPEKTL